VCRTTGHPRRKTPLLRGRSPRIPARTTQHVPLLLGGQERPRRVSRTLQERFR
jgi:hypothetical protein